MREIRFRAWDGKEVVRFDDGLVLQFKNTEWGFNISDGFELAEIFTSSNGKGALMQYTGLKDRNGTEIYEGDIIQNGTEKMVVIWDESDAGYWLEFDNGNQSVGINQRVMQTCEIIGNIYENPELLGREE